MESRVNTASMRNQPLVLDLIVLKKKKTKPKPINKVAKNRNYQ